MEMKALVTGGGGFIGSRLVRLLLGQGYSVRVLDVQRGRLEGDHSPRLEFVGLGADDLRGGMADRRTVDEATEGVDVVYHLAINWDGHSWAQTLPLAELMDVNIRGTLTLLGASRSQGVKHFVYSSSIAVYGKRDSPVMDEETICKPELWRGGPGPGYAITKLAIERLCLFYGVTHGLPVTVFRIDVVFDDDEYQDLSLKTIRAALHGEPLKVEKGEEGTSIHVDDVAGAFAMATLNKRAYDQVFNLSNPGARVCAMRNARWPSALNHTPWRRAGIEPGSSWRSVARNSPVGSRARTVRESMPNGDPSCACCSSSAARNAGAEKRCESTSGLNA